MHSKSVLCLLIVLLIAFLPRLSATLTNSEIQGLKELSSIFSLFHEASTLSVAIASEGYGGKWPSSWNARSCDAGEGWFYYGIHCSADGHIDALHLYVYTLARDFLHIFSLQFQHYYIFISFLIR